MIAARAEGAADSLVQRQAPWTDADDRRASESLSEPSDQRWSARRFLFVVFVSNVVLWTAVIAGVRALF